MATNAHTEIVASERRFKFFTIHVSLCSMALIRGLNMHMKTIRSVMYSGLVGLTVLAAMSAQALQTVDPKLSLAGASINGTTQAVPAGSTFTVYGVWRRLCQSRKRTGPEGQVQRYAPDGRHNQ